MTQIVLTDEQRRLLPADHDRPVDVLDPATHQRYVLVAWEQFERLCSPEQGGPEQTIPPGLSLAAASAPEGVPLRQRVRDLPLPAEVATEAKRYCQRLGLWRAKSRRRMEEQMKLQHYYGGLWIAYLETGEGPVVVAAAKSLDELVFDQQLAFLSEAERRSTIIDSPTRLFSQQSEILTPFADES